MYKITSQSSGFGSLHGQCTRELIANDFKHLLHLLRRECLLYETHTFLVTNLVTKKIREIQIFELSECAKADTQNNFELSIFSIAQKIK